MEQCSSGKGIGLNLIKKDVKYENNNKEVGEYLIHVWGGEDFTSIKATEKNC